MTKSKIKPKATEKLPKYQQPPVNEVVCHVAFSELKKLTAPHLGEYWQLIKKDYPVVEEQSPIISPIENEEPSPWPSLPRTWFVNPKNHALIQIQKDRFIHNWRKKDDEDTYPSFKNVFIEFTQRLEQFNNFIEKQELGKIKPVQFELTYVNHIPKDDRIWSSLDDLSKLFIAFSGSTGSKKFLNKMKGMSFVTNYSLPNEEGIFATKLDSAIHNESKKEILRLTMLAKGITKERSLSDLPRWFNMAHEWIVLGFEDITTINAQTDVWRKRND